MLILHVGLPKTGTTFLQHRIFARSPGIAFVHRSQGGATATFVRDLRSYFNTGPVRARWRRRALRTRLDTMTAEGRPVLLSEENLSISATGFWLGRGHTPTEFARRLSALARGLQPGLAPIKLIVGIRRQDRWLASRYAQSSAQSAAFTQQDFDRRMREVAAAPALPDAFAWLDYPAMRDALATAVGVDNVLLLPLERLAEDPLETLACVSRFLGREIVAEGQRFSVNPKNRLSIGENQWRMRRDDSPLIIDPGLQRALRARFADSNRRLAAVTPLGYEP